MRHRGRPLLLDQKRDARRRMSMARGSSQRMLAVSLKRPNRGEKGRIGADDAYSRPG